MRLDAHLDQVVGELLGHPLGQRGDQARARPCSTRCDLLQQVVDLALGRLDLDRRVDQAGRPDDLLDDLLGCARIS